MIEDIRHNVLEASPSGKAILEKEEFKSSLLGFDAFNGLVDVIETQVREDQFTVKMNLLHLFSAYLPEPMNLYSIAPTSEGKTYPIVQAASIFPKCDVLLLGGLSPTAIAHDNGVLVDRDTGQEIEPLIKDLGIAMRDAEGKDNKQAFKDQINALLRNAVNRVDLDSKIALFLDNPNTDTMDRLRPILSHDVPQISYKFTDRKKGGPLQTMETVVRGWPVVVLNWPRVTLV